MKGAGKGLSDGRTEGRSDCEKTGREHVMDDISEGESEITIERERCT